ncbi:MAG TPA: FAD-dependent oxidoreductase [Alphaproteobacteria bacterium]|nr:FAD-dependent oxidoreductase [Alphaproteobacteria bacterium]
MDRRSKPDGTFAGSSNHVGFGRRQMLGAATAALGGAALAAPIAAAAPETHVRKWDHDFDVIVIGFGVSGGAAAYEALKAGARTLVLDRGSAAHSESHGVNVYMGGGTPLQKAYKVEDTPENMLKYLLASQGPQPEKEKISIFVDRSLGHFQWLLDIGMRFSEDPQDKCLSYSGNENAWPCNGWAVPAMRGHRPPGRGGTGAWIQKTLLEATRQGATQLLAADAERLVQGSDGAIQGVLASVDGKTQSFRARRGVILATGGFANNRDMVARYAPEYLACAPLDVGSNDGWGIRAGQAVRAGISRISGVNCFAAFQPPVERIQGILVNRLGQRFLPEDSYYGVIAEAIVMRQGGVAHLVVDAEAFGDPSKRPHVAGMPERDEIAARADTVAELEQKLGIPAPDLQQTIETYNRYAANGHDPLFFKNAVYLRPLTKPPFTAIKGSVGDAYFTYFTVGGLQTTPDTEVLDIDGAPIPGLYAVGRTATGVLGPHFYHSGISLGEGTIFGRIAGEHAASRRA